MIDFEKEFHKYIKVWMKEQGLSEDDYEVVDDRIAEVYQNWLKIPSEVFGGKSPSEFFNNIDSPLNLFKQLGKYIYSGTPVPGPLLNRMIELKETVYPILISTIRNFEGEDEKSDKIKAYCVELISEMNGVHPIEDYIKEIKNLKTRSESSEAMIKILINNAHDIKPDLKTAYLEAKSEYSKDSFLDILSELKNDDEAYEYALDCFLNDFSKSGMYALMLSKIGKLECADYLKDRMKDPSTNYYNFCAIKEALEELGEESNIDRDFSDDEDFKYLSSLTNEENSEELNREEDFDE